jgi:pimeloyl-ACP methyl ester carboxylesterase
MPLKGAYPMQVKAGIQATNVALRWALPLFLSTGAFFLAAEVVRADLVILKDGFVLYGKVRQDKVFFADPISKQVFYTAKLDGFYMVDDDARRVIFSAGQVADVTKQDFNQAADIIRFGKAPKFRGGKPLDVFWHVKEVTAFDRSWHRNIQLETPTRRFTVRQKLTELTPHHVRVDNYEYNWTECYLTSELGPEAVRTLVLQHLGRKGQLIKPTEADKRFHLFRFLLQAGWPATAEKELRDLETDHPEEKKRLVESLVILKKLQGLKMVEALERAHKVGQPREARRLLIQIKRLKVDGDLVGDQKIGAVRAIDEKIKAADEDFQLAQKYLEELPRRVKAVDHKKVFVEAARVIAEDLRLDTLPRLEGFIGLAKQEERYGKQGKRAGQNPAELLAMAVSGWLLGNDSAEAAPETAIRLWNARQFVLKYQRTPRERERLGMLSLKPGSAVGLDEMAQVIRFLPPPEPVKKIDTLVREVQVVNPDGSKGPTYFIKLPPEYHHNRAYPVLLVLHGSEEGAKEQLARWTGLAAERGFILAAPVWNKGLGGEYDYSPEEHFIVMETLRDLRRHLQVDSDRVFLFGFEEGGNMAFDVGLSHPDLFAGVATMGGKPRWHAYHYWTNAQNLPFYVIDGSANGVNAKYNRDVFKQWVQHGYPCLYVEYQGRGPEWLSGEMPHVFEWMEPKARAHPRSGLGGQQDYKSMRNTDNRFYWLSTSSIKTGAINEPGGGWKTPPTPALFEGNIGSSNYIYVSTRHVRDITVWLAPAMIDFEKPVTIRVNGTIAVPNTKVVPSLKTMLEDFYERGDRQQLFLAKKVFTVK